MRLSQAYEDRQGTSNYQSPPPGRTEEIVSVKLEFPPSKRVRTRDEFRRIRKSGKKITGQVVVFDVLSEKTPYRHRLGLTVSKRFGNAVARNRFKRLIREAFRLTAIPSTPWLSINASPRRLKRIFYLALAYFSRNFRSVEKTSTTRKSVLC
jgi:ribonuclease P protein component